MTHQKAFQDILPKTYISPQFVLHGFTYQPMWPKLTYESAAKTGASWKVEDGKSLLRRCLAQCVETESTVESMETYEVTPFGFRVVLFQKTDLYIIKTNPKTCYKDN